MVAICCGCVADHHPAIPSLFYRASLPAAPDSTCAELATALIDRVNLARDSSYEVALGGSRCHEILYAADGNEVWLQLRSDQLTIAVRNYPQPGEIELPDAGTQALADTATAIVKERFPGTAVERGTERE